MRTIRASHASILITDADLLARHFPGVARINACQLLPVLVTWGRSLVLFKKPPFVGQLLLVAWGCMVKRLFSQSLIRTGY